MIDSQNDEGWTALSDAANSGHADTVRTLLKHGSSANKLDDRGSAPIFYAHKHKDIRTRKLLIC
jgi:ankyrin repeat protein